MFGLSLRLWSSAGSCCLVFDTATNSVVDTILSILQHHDGLGQPPLQLLQVGNVKSLCFFFINLYLQRAKEIALGDADAFRRVEISSSVSEAVQEVLDCINNQGQEQVIDNNSKKVSLKTNEQKLPNCITNNTVAISPSPEKIASNPKIMTPLVIKGEHEILQDLEICEMSPEKDIVIEMQEICEPLNSSDKKELVGLNPMLISPDKTGIGLGFKNTEKDEKPILRLLDESVLQRFCQICDVDQHIWGTKDHYIRYHTVSSQFVYPCSLCWEWFPTKDDLKDHMEYHRNGDAQNLYCKICEKPVKKAQSSSIFFVKSKNASIFHNGQQSLDEHMLTCKSSTICNRCNKVFKTKTDCLAHVRVRHGSLIACEMCGKIFTKAANLEQHINVVHTKTLQFKCDQCSKTYSSRQPLNIHKRNHTHTSRDIQCDQCPMAFNTKEKLHQHFVNVHKKVKPIQCDFKDCEKSFKKKANLKRHIILHEEGPQGRKTRTSKRKIANPIDTEAHVN